MSASDQLELSRPASRRDGRIDSISLTAVAAFIFALASVLGCMVAAVMGTLVTPAAFVIVLVLPFPALIGAVLGGVAMRNISRSQGRLGGRTMALIALFLGLISAALQGAVAGSALATYWPVKTRVAPVVGEFARAVAAGDFTSARVALSPSASQVVTNEQMRALLAPAAVQLGAFRQATFGLDVFVDSFRQVRESASRAAAGGGPGLGGPGEAPKPVGLGFARGRVIAYVFVDQGALAQGSVEILDMLVVNMTGPATALLPDGPAIQAARSLGMPVAIPPGAPDAPT
jgi:hypothetical protein